MRESCIFFLNDTATTEIYTLSLHDALPIYDDVGSLGPHELPGHARRPGDRLVGLERALLGGEDVVLGRRREAQPLRLGVRRSEEHTSELQSRQYLVCRLLLEKQNTTFSLVT